MILLAASFPGMKIGKAGLKPCAYRLPGIFPLERCAQPGKMPGAARSFDKMNTSQMNPVIGQLHFQKRYADWLSTGDQLLYRKDRKNGSIYKIGCQVPEMILDLACETW